jgi:hypothetical protein
MEGSLEDNASSQAGHCALDSESYNVVMSAIYNQRLQVKEQGSIKKTQEPKLLLEIPVCELHNLLVAPLEQGGLPQTRDEDGIILVGNTTLEHVMKKDLPQLHHMSLRHKKM